MTPKQQALIDKCEWIDTNNAVRGVVNDVVWMDNRRAVGIWATENGYTQQQVSACIKWIKDRDEKTKKDKAARDKKKQALQATSKAMGEQSGAGQIKQPKVMTGNQNTGPGFYDQIAGEVK